MTGLPSLPGPGLNILCIGCGEGGGKIAASAAKIGINTIAINTNVQDLSKLNFPESKKLLLKISAGGSGKDPNFVKESLKNINIKSEIVEFIKKSLITTPLFSICPNCKIKEKINDLEAVSDTHICSNCGLGFSLIDIEKDKNEKHNYIFISVCLGGGSGSGLLSDIVEICHFNFNLPIAVIATLPDEQEDIVTKNNAIYVFQDIYNKYASKGIISPLILIDNQKMIEMHNQVLLGSMYASINNLISKSVFKFLDFSNQVSSSVSNIDFMDSARLFSLGGCGTIGKFIVGPSKLDRNANLIKVPHPLDIEAINEALIHCAFVDGLDLLSTRGVGIVAVAPEHFLQDENISKCIKYVYGKIKEMTGAELVFRGQYNDPSLDCLEFYIFFNGLKYPEEKFEKMWKDIKEGKVNSQRKRERIDELPYDTKIES